MRRTSLQSVLALLLAFLLVAPVTSATAGGAVEETMTGVLEAVHVDAFASRSAHEEYVLRTSRGITALAFADSGPIGLGGATVTVTGTRVGKGLHVASSKPGRDLRVLGVPPARDLGAETVNVAALDGAGTTTGTVAPLITTAASTVAKSFAVVMINFADLRTQPWSTSTVQAALTSSTGSLKAFYEEESKGRLTLGGSVFGWYTIDAPTTGCDWRTWHTLGYNAAAAAGVNLASYTNVMFVWPYTSQCGFAGVGYVPGAYTYLNGTIDVHVMTHEVGHNFGLGHANAYSCTSNGVRVTISASCTEQVYADPFSTMGNNAARHNQGSQLGELGWLGDGEVVVGSPGNTYTISPYFGAGGVKLVRIPRGDGTFFDLDFRTTYGAFDDFAAGSPVVIGVTIRIGRGTASPTRLPLPTDLLDATPATADLRDAPLLVGRTITDPVSTISFTTTAVTSAGVTVRVGEGLAPSAPGSLTATPAALPSVELAWAAATDNVVVTGYRISRDGTVVAAAAGTARLWTDAAVSPGATYTYGVAALDGSGNVGPARSASATIPGGPDPSPSPSPTPAPSPKPTASPGPAAAPTPDVQAPTLPTPLGALPAITTVTLTWGAATDNTGVAGYRISRNGVATATAAGTSWTDAGRAPLTWYTYRVQAVDAAGNTGPASQISVRTKADTIRPTTPTNFRRLKRSGAYVTFAWSAARDNVRVARYLVFRVGRSTPILSTTRTSARFWTRSGAYYYVRAVDAAGNRSPTSRAVRGR